MAAPANTSLVLTLASKTWPQQLPGATITDLRLPFVIGPEARDGTIVLTDPKSTPVLLQVSISGQPMPVQATPASYLRIAQVGG